MLRERGQSVICKAGIDCMAVQVHSQVIDPCLLKLPTHIYYWKRIHIKANLWNEL